MTGRCIKTERLADFAKHPAEMDRHDELAHHLDDCPSCRQKLARIRGAQATLRAIAEMDPPELSAARAARMEAALRWTGQADALRERRVMWRSAFAMGALAAVAVGVIAVRAHWSTPASKVVAVAQTPATKMIGARGASLHGLVTLLQGEVELRRQGQAERVTLATEILRNDAISTSPNGRLSFQWGEGSGAQLLPASELTIAALDARQQEFGLSRGQVAVRVGPHQPGESLRVTTPGHVVSVHGTWFIVGVEGGGTTVEVIEGVVEVEERGGGGTAMRIAAPMRTFFQLGQLAQKGQTGPLGRAHTSNAAALSTKEVAALRQMTEMGLLPLPGDQGLGDLLARTSALHVTSSPGVAIAVDGIPFGNGAIWLRRPRGSHLIELSRPGFHTLSRWVSVGNEEGELHSPLAPIEQAQPAAGAASEDATAPEDVQVHGRVPTAHDFGLLRTRPQARPHPVGNRDHRLPYRPDGPGRSDGS